MIGRLESYILADFNDEARYAVMWTSTLLKDNYIYLSSQPTFTTIGDYTLAHASPRYPIWEYIRYSNSEGEF